MVHPRTDGPLVATTKGTPRCISPHNVIRPKSVLQRAAGRTMVRPRIFAFDTTRNAHETWHAESLSAAKWRTERYSPLELRPGPVGCDLVRLVRSINRGEAPDQRALGRR